MVIMEDMCSNKDDIIGMVKNLTEMIATITLVAAVMLPIIYSLSAQTEMKPLILKTAVSKGHFMEDLQII